VADLSHLNAAIRRIAEERIRNAAKRGEFDNLEGAGKPLPGADEPWDEFWWMRKWLKREKLNKGEASRELIKALQEMRQAKRS